MECPDCHGTGRRPPTLPEWDDLVAERDRYRGTLQTIATAGPAPVRSFAYRLMGYARAALDREDARE